MKKTPLRGEVIRCPWPADDALMIAYHDKEWGVPVRKDQALFGKLVLDGFQAGLSWRTILYKKESFLRAFKRFDPAQVARFTARDVARLMNDAGIIRNRQKIEGAIKSARAYLRLREERGSFSDFLWDFVGGEPKVNRWRRLAQLPAESKESRAMSKELRALDFAFVGPTICYAFMQAVGMVNDHLVTCYRHGEV
jgi:DNA-3-methyladenine glycosylase I